MANFYKGQRVITPLGKGGVAYQRMKPPDYKETESVSVVLDSRRNDINYTGTIFPANEIKEDD